GHVVERRDDAHRVEGGVAEGQPRRVADADVDALPRVHVHADAVAVASDEVVVAAGDVEEPSAQPRPDDAGAPRFEKVHPGHGGEYRGPPTCYRVRLC